MDAFSILLGISISPKGKRFDKPPILPKRPIGQGRNTSLIHRPKHGHLQSLTDTPYSIGMAHQFMKRTPSLTKDRIQVLFWSIDHGKLSSLGSGSPRIGNTTRLGAKKEYTGSMYRYAHSRRSCLKGQIRPYETAGLRDVGYKKQALSHSDKENTSHGRTEKNH